MRALGLGWCILLCVVAACEGGEGRLLLVDLRTDFALGPELDRIEVATVRGPEAIFVRAQPRGPDPLAGVRVAEVDDVSPGL